jgi:hypothetical protein
LPVSTLVEPGEPDENITNGFVNPLDVFNYISPSAWVSDIIEKCTGLDIFGYATDALTGEWGALYKFGDALGALAQYVQELGIQIQAGMIEADATWDGNANDAAYNYFSSLAAKTSGQQTALREAAKGIPRGCQRRVAAVEPGRQPAPGRRGQGDHHRDLGSRRYRNRRDRSRRGRRVRRRLLAGH